MNSRFRIVVAIGLAVSLLTASLSAAAQDNEIDNGERVFHPFAADEFYDVWERTDYPVQQLEVARTWIWGPGPITPGLDEQYAEAEDGERLVQYFDKSRMEWPWSPEADPESEWFITQGLLATELMTGNLQLGDDTFEQHEPAEIPVAGDWEDQTGPTYAAMGEYIDWEPRPEGSMITQIMDREGNISDEEQLAGYEVTDAYYIEQTDHNIASVFWEFMQSEGLVYVDGDYTTDTLFTNEFYAIGYPTTEAYWGWVTVDGVDQNVLIQCFERRCLTYTPDNPEGWEVESGNVGLHYYEWRYNIIGDPIVDPELSVGLDPEDATNNVGTEHNLTATVFENGTSVAIGDEDDVSISVSRDDDDVDVNETVAIDDAGVATISYTGPEDPAVDTIAVNVDYNGEQVSATATKTWVEADPPEEELSGTFTFNGETTARVEVEHYVTLTAHLTVNGEDADGETVYFWIDEEYEDIISIEPFSATTDMNGTAEVTVTGVAEGTATVNAFVDVDGSGVYNPETDVDLGSVDVIVGPIPPEEFEATASDAGGVLSEGQLEDGRDYWQVEIFLTEEDRDANNPLNPQEAWDVGELTRIIYERPNGTTMDLEPEGTAYLWWVGTYADGQHTVYYLVDGEWYALTSTFEAGELIAVNEDPYSP